MLHLISCNDHSSFRPAISLVPQLVRLTQVEEQTHIQPVIVQAVDAPEAAEAELIGESHKSARFQGSGTIRPAKKFRSFIFFFGMSIISYRVSRVSGLFLGFPGTKTPCNKA